MTEPEPLEAPLFVVAPPKPKGGKSTGGPVYQGVNDQVAALFPVRTGPDAGEYMKRAGIVAAARSLAASIDRASGHGGGRQASGHQLALMHAQLREHLEAMAPAADPGTDPFADFLESLNAGSTDGHPATPHTP